MYSQRYNLFDLRHKLIWFEQILISFKDTLFESNKFYLIQINHFFKAKKVFQTNLFLWFNQIFFSESTDFDDLSDKIPHLYWNITFIPKIKNKKIFLWEKLEKNK